MFQRFICLFFALGLAACSSSSKYDVNTPEGAFLTAEDLAKDERYEEAVQQFSEVKNKHPYSRFAVQAELRIADVHYDREAFVEAQNAYQTFKELHPKHAQIAYVTFRLGLSYYKQLPSTIDRDLSLAEKAILFFDEVTNSYPNSEFAQQAKEKKTECSVMLAKKELYIARFYVKKELFDSAQHRFETVMKKYAGLGLDQEALYGAAKSALLAGDKDQGQKYLRDLYQRFPNSDEAERAKNEFKQYGPN